MNFQEYRQAIYTPFFEEVQDNQNFKKWFGKSVLHTNGEPHTFYHGTASDIKAFSHDHTGKGVDALGSGFYFTNKPDSASHYASVRATDQNGQNVIPVHLRVTKPIYKDQEKPFTRAHIMKMISNAPNHKETLGNFGDVRHEGYFKVLTGAVDSYTDMPKIHAMHAMSNDFYGQDHQAFLQNLTKHTGHDAVIDKYDDHTIVNVFHPNQIKSAIGNSGTFSKKSDNITESN